MFSRQLRQLLQGHYKAYGQSVPWTISPIISTGNIDADMEGCGQMVPLDLPNAKRFLMTVKVPSLGTMDRESQRAIIRWQVDPELRRKSCAKFAAKFVKVAVETGQSSKGTGEDEKENSSSPKTKR